MKRRSTDGRFDIGEMVKDLKTNKEAMVMEYTNCDDGCCEGYLLDIDDNWRDDWDLEQLEEDED